MGRSTIVRVKKTPSSATASGRGRGSSVRGRGRGRGGAANPTSQVNPDVMDNISRPLCNDDIAQPTVDGGSAGSKRPRSLLEDDDTSRSVKRTANINSDYQEVELEASDAAKDNKSDSKEEEGDAYLDNKVRSHLSAGPQELNGGKGT